MFGFLILVTMKTASSWMWCHTVW